MRFDSFAHLLSHFAAASPDAPALRYETETLSFAALYDRVCARAAQLKALTGKSLATLAVEAAKRPKLVQMELFG